MKVIQHTVTLPRLMGTLALMNFVEASLLQCENNSQGSDNIPYKMLWCLSAEDHRFLLHCTTESTDWESSHQLSKRQLSSLFRSLDRDNSSPHSYRSIARISCTCMILKRLVNVRLVLWLKQKNILSAVQCRFRNNQSLVDCLVV